MSRFSQTRIATWVKSVFPPSSAGIFSPGEFEQLVRLVQNALPSSLALSRMRINQQFTTNPATVLNTVPVPPNRFWYVHAADWTLFSGQATTSGIALVQIADPAGVDQAVTVGSGEFIAGGVGQFDASKVFTHSGSLTAIGFANPATNTGGGGSGGFIVPAGHVIRGLTSQTPGTAVYRLNWLFVEMLDGEEVPSFS